MKPDLKPFFEGKALIAVVGASNNPEKYGYKVYKDLKSAGMNVVPVNPNHDTIQNDRCYHTLSDIPDVPNAISVITPPAATEKIVAEAIKLGIKNIWLQPGAESEKAISMCEKAGVNVVSRICIMVQRRIGPKDPFDEIMDQLEKYDEGTTPPKASDLIHCDD